MGRFWLTRDSTAGVLEGVVDVWRSEPVRIESRDGEDVTWVGGFWVGPGRDFSTPRVCLLDTVYCEEALRYYKVIPENDFEYLLVPASLSQGDV